MSKKVLLIYDRPDWAFHSQAKGLVAYNKLPIEYEMCGYIDLPKMDKNKYDIIFSMGLLLSLHWFVQDFIKDKEYVTLVHHYPTQTGLDNAVPKEHIRKEAKVAREANRHASISRPVQKLWKDKYNVTSCYLPAGIDCNRFNPGVKKKTDIFTVGFCGNTDKKLKGFNDIIVPAVNRLKQIGYKIELKVKGYSDLMPHEEMVKFYEDIDLYLCASSAEGLPTPLVEASSCGIPYVATDVGVVKEINCAGQNVIIEREIDSLALGIIESMASKKLSTSGQINREMIEAGWDWKHLSDTWGHFILGESKHYHKCMKERAERMIEVKRKYEN